LNSRWIYSEYDNGEGLLLDMENDPQARRNAVNNSNSVETVNLLKERLYQFRAQAKVLPCGRIRTENM